MRNLSKACRGEWHLCSSLERFQCLTKDIDTISLMYIGSTKELLDFLYEIFHQEELVVCCSGYHLSWTQSLVQLEWCREILDANGKFIGGDRTSMSFWLTLLIFWHAKFYHLGIAEWKEMKTTRMMVGLLIFCWICEACIMSK